MWLEQESEGPSSCAVFLALPQAPFKFGEAIFPVHAPVFQSMKLLQDLIGLL